MGFCSRLADKRRELKIFLLADGGFKLRFEQVYVVDEILLSFEFFPEHVKRLLSARVGKLDHALGGNQQSVKIIRVERGFKLVENERERARVALSRRTDHAERRRSRIVIVVFIGGELVTHL